VALPKTVATARCRAGPFTWPHVGALLPVEFDRRDLLAEERTATQLMVEAAPKHAARFGGTMKLTC